MLSAEPALSRQQVSCRVVCGSVEFNVTLTQKLLGRPFVDALVSPVLKAYNKKLSSEQPHLTVEKLKKVEVDGNAVDSLQMPAGELLPGKTARVCLVPLPPERDKLVIDDDEWGSDEDENDVMGHRLHRKNLSMLTKYLHRPGLWRVRMNNVFEIMEVGSASKIGGPPGPFEFSLKVTADGREPTSGPLTRLADKTAGYVEILVKDLQKVARAKDLAHADALATRDSKRGEEHVQEMTRAVGALPVSRVEVEAEESRRLASEAAEAAAQRKRDELEVHEQLGQLSLEEEMRKAEKKAAKRARQRARKRELASADVSVALTGSEGSTR